MRYLKNSKSMKVATTRRLARIQNGSASTHACGHTFHHTPRKSRPVSIKMTASIRPTRAAVRVAVSRSCVRSSSERSTRPPSSGAPAGVSAADGLGGVFDLIADGDAEALLHQPRDVAVDPVGGADEPEHDCGRLKGLLGCPVGGSSAQRSPHYSQMA